MVKGDSALESSEKGDLSVAKRGRDAPKEGTLSQFPQHWSEGLGNLKAELYS